MKQDNILKEAAACKDYVGESSLVCMCHASYNQQLVVHILQGKQLLDITSLKAAAGSYEELWGAAKVLNVQSCQMFQLSTSPKTAPSKYCVTFMTWEVTRVTSEIQVQNRITSHIGATSPFHSL